MRRISVVLVLATLAAFPSSAAEADVILKAQQDALEDSQDYHALWWGVGGVALTVVPVLYGAFFGGSISVEARRAVALVDPVVGGTSLTLVGYFTGKAKMPDARIADMQGEYKDAHLQSLYVTTYEKTLTKVQRRKRGNAALIGSGASIGVMGLGFLVVYMTK